jgi:hypothetical protein
MVGEVTRGVQVKHSCMLVQSRGRNRPWHRCNEVLTAISIVSVQCTLHVGLQQQHSVGVQGHRKCHSQHM